MTTSTAIEKRMDQTRRAALILGLIALVVCIAGAFRSPTQFFRSYLFAYLFWFEIGLGSIAILMMHHLVGGWWSFIIRRPLESGGSTLALLGVLFVPLLFGISRLYLWAQPAAVAADPILLQKRFYLTPALFVTRAVVYFALWIVMGYLLNKWSLEQDRTADPSLRRRLGALSGPGLIVYGLTITFASIDWVMSLDPHWTSTIYGMIFMIIAALAAMSFAIVVAMLLSETEPLRGIIAPDRLLDLGNMLLTFVMLWAYLMFSQFLIIWSGNLRQEIPWYTVRGTGEWGWVAVLLMVFHFGVPFLMLLQRPVKRRVRLLAGLAAGLLVMTVVDLFWVVMPSFDPAGPRFHWMDWLAMIGIGGVWIAAFLTQLKGKPVLPVHDPRFEGAPSYGD